jgi:hypothetical protein
MLRDGDVIVPVTLHAGDKPNCKSLKALVPTRGSRSAILRTLTEALKMNVIRLNAKERLWIDEVHECEILERTERGRRQYFEREFYGTRWYDIAPPARLRRRSRRGCGI